MQEIQKTEEKAAVSRTYEFSLGGGGSPQPASYAQDDDIRPAKPAAIAMQLHFPLNLFQKVPPAEAFFVFSIPVMICGTMFRPPGA